MNIRRSQSIADGSPCPFCGEGVIHKKIGEATFCYKGQSISFENYVSHVCDSCEEDFVAPGDNASCEQELATFRNHVDGLLSPQEIRKVRKALSFSQAKFAEILGVGVKNFAKYENGAMRPSKTTSHLLRILFYHPSMLECVFDGGLRDTRNTTLTCTQEYKFIQDEKVSLALDKALVNATFHFSDTFSEHEKCA